MADRDGATESGSTELERRLGHSFDDRALLVRALTHRSYCAEHDGAESNERLEFLGDAVLGWVIADVAFGRYDVPEGRLTDLRKSVVNQTALAEIADDLGIGTDLRLGRGEAAAGGAAKPSILSDALEALIGAVYVDAGADAAYDFVERHVAPRLDPTASIHHLDHKTSLQELVAAGGWQPPEYQLRSDGPDHAKVFTAEVRVDGRVVGSGTGGSKKSAEQAAAQAAVSELASDAGA